MNTFTCEGTIKNIKNEAQVGKYVRFRITSVGTDDEDNVVYPKDTVSVETDATGSFSQELWINGDSGRTAVYEIQVSTQREKVSVIIPSNVAGTVVRLEDIINLYEVSGTPTALPPLTAAYAYTDTFAADASANASFNKAAWLADLGFPSAVPADSTILVSDGTSYVGESGATARASLGLSIGTNVQAWDAQLDDIAALTPSDEAVIRGNGTNWVVASNFRIDTGALNTGTEMGTGVADGNYAVAEGDDTAASGDCSGATGRRGKGIHDGARVEADSQDADVSSTTTDQFTARFQNGYEFKGGLATFDGGISVSTFRASSYEVNAQTGTAYTLALTDSGAIVTMSNAAANVSTVPTNAAVPFAIGSVISVVMGGAGTTSVTGDTGVIINGVSAGSVAISAQYQGLSLLKVATDTWIASGAF